MTISDLIDKTSAELVEELLEATAREGVPWFPIVRAKLAALEVNLRLRRKPTYVRTEGLHQ